MTIPELLGPGCCSVVAAAGCGKTEAIARAVASATGRQLVLTHTNAGVEALLRRLRRIKAGHDKASVDTIAGWCRKYVASYPQLSRWTATDDEERPNFDSLYPAMAELTRESVIRKVLEASYAGVFVDEYQDCTVGQHELIQALGQVLPTRILGDPLQAVFRFRGEPPPWKEQVEVAFPRVATLTTPWRWQRPGENAALGDWLIHARECLEKHESLCLKDARIRYVETPSHTDWVGTLQSVAFEVVGDADTVVAILKWPDDGGYHLVGRVTGGFFQCVEAIDPRGGPDLLRKLQDASAFDRPALLMGFVPLIAIGHEDALTAVSEALRCGVTDALEPCLVEATSALEAVADGAPPGKAAQALENMAKASKVKVFRRELLWAIVDTLRDANPDGYQGLLAKLRRRRQLMSHVGRRLARRSAGSTLLLKGMEFDHAIVIDTGDFTVNDFYVAITRGSKSLTVLSPQPIIHADTFRSS